MEVETIKTATWSYIWLYDCRPKSVSAGLSCSVVCTSAMSVTQAAYAACSAIYV